jgi:hypothetical protein
MNNDQLYINFDEYIKAREPHVRERAEAWRVAIGLQAVDGLKVSDYLKETARRNIEGEITIDEVRELVKQYYVSKTQHDEDDEEKEEADFREGNTRTTAVFTIKYLQSIGFKTDNRQFEEHSWYFRNALVRANYKNVAKGVSQDSHFLELFFRNLLLGENNELKNRYMLVNPPEEWNIPQAPEQVQDKHGTSTGQVQDKLHTHNANILKLVQVVGEQELSVKEMMSGVELKGRDNFLNLYLTPAIADGFVRLLYPDKPRHPRQKYLLTVKGLTLYNELKN